MEGGGGGAKKEIGWWHAVLVSYVVYIWLNISNKRKERRREKNKEAYMGTALSGVPVLYQLMSNDIGGKSGRRVSRTPKRWICYSTYMG